MVILVRGRESTLLHGDLNLTYVWVQLESYRLVHLCSLFPVYFRASIFWLHKSSRSMLFNVVAFVDLLSPAGLRTCFVPVIAVKISKLKWGQRYIEPPEGIYIGCYFKTNSWLKLIFLDLLHPVCKFVLSTPPIWHPTSNIYLDKSLHFNILFLFDGVISYMRDLYILIILSSQF